MLGSESRVRVFIFQSEPTREHVKVSHVVVECRVNNHHPDILFHHTMRRRKCAQLFANEDS